MLFKPQPLICGLLLSSGLLMTSACQPEKVKQYRVAKVADPPTADKPVADLNTPFTFAVPQGWQKQASTGMRTASFSIPGGGDVSVVTLPGMAGDLKGNVNRWRGQVGLEPVEDANVIQKSVGAASIDGAQAVTLELYSPQGKPDKAMRVALFEKDGVTWFFKLAGPAQLVKAQKTPFESFTKSIKFKANSGFGAQAALPAPDSAAPDNSGAMPPMAGADTGAGPAAGAPAGSDMSAGGMPPIKPQATDTKLTYDLPGSWKEKDPGPVRIASFDVVQGDLSADVSIVNLAGDGGGLLSNTNRWRQQLEMAPTDQAGLKNSVKDITIDGNKGYFMALYTGMDGKGMLVALVEQGGQTWFIKMVGPSKLMQAQEQDFQSFAKSIKFHAKGSQT